jgi:hypothetical protein
MTHEDRVRVAARALHVLHNEVRAQMGEEPSTAGSHCHNCWAEAEVSVTAVTDAELALAV